MSLRFLLLLSFVLLPCTHSFYLPGVAPRNFKTGDILRVKVNKLTSTRTQLPYDYYSLRYCKPRTIINSDENLGEVLRGDRIENSVYSFQMRKPKQCIVACRVRLDSESAKSFISRINDRYRVNMILDNLPVVVIKQRRSNADNGDESNIHELGFPVGYRSTEGKYYIHNHLSFEVLYHKDPVDNSAHVVGFHVTPSSVRHEYYGWKGERTQLNTCNAHLFKELTTAQEVGNDTEVVFTYEVSFESSEIKWISRWDTYLHVEDNPIHWFSVIDSLFVVLFLSGMVAIIMTRTVYRDINRYNRLDSLGEGPEETGWKLVHADVFRPPSNSSLLCVQVGTGIQVFGMTLITMFCALLGFLSPSGRGGLMTAMIFLWSFMGVFAGFCSAHLHKTMKGRNWKKVAFKTAFMFPTILFTIFLMLNALIWGEKSSGAVPFSTMFALVVIWFGISVPLVIFGSFLGYRFFTIDDPVRTNKIPRQIPAKPWYICQKIGILIVGFLPFGAAFIELSFILTSIWLNQFHYIFGFLCLVFVLLVVTCAETAILLCYGMLCLEDYHWWWRSYFTSGTSALYLFLYSTVYFFNKLEITKLVSGILYFGYMLVASYLFFVLTGTIGFYACLWFVRKIYSSVKIE